MARFKVVGMGPRFLPVVLEEQLIPGTFEFALHSLIDSEFDLSALEAKFKNDETGAPAYDPAVMLKIVLLAYRGAPSRLDARTLSDRVYPELLARQKVLNLRTMAGFDWKASATGLCAEAHGFSPHVAVRTGCSTYRRSR